MKDENKVLDFQVIKKALEEKPTEKKTVEDWLRDIQKRNAENKERMRKERLKANESVTRSYRLKKKS